MMTKVQSSNTLNVLDGLRPLASMSGQVATPEQQIDLLGFWEMGMRGLKTMSSFLY